MINLKGMVWVAALAIAFGFILPLAYSLSRGAH